MTCAASTCAARISPRLASSVATSPAPISMERLSRTLCRHDLDLREIASKRSARRLPNSIAMRCSRSSPSWSRSTYRRPTADARAPGRNARRLRGASFAQIIAALQTRFEHPELALFAVDGEQVSVRVGGVMQPLAAGRQPLQAADLPRPSAGVRVVETTLQQRPLPAPAAAPAVVPGTAPPPTRGLSVRGRPGGEGATPSPAPASVPPQAPTAAPSASPPANPPAAGAAPAAPNAEKPDNSGDDASARFSLLELD